MKEKNIKSQIERFLQIPLKMIFVLLFMVFTAFLYNRKVGVLVGLFVVVYTVLVLIMYYTHRPRIMSSLVSYAFEQGQVQKALLKELALPYALIDMDGMILWHNHQFEDMVSETKISQDIHKYFPHIAREMFPGAKDDITEYSMNYEYRQ